MAQAEAAKRQARANIKADSRKAASDTKAGRYFTRNLHTPLVQPLENFLTVRKAGGKFHNSAIALRETAIETETLAWLITKAIINAIGLSSKPVKRVSLSAAIGNIIHDEWRIRKFSDTRERYALVRKLAKDFDRRNYSRDKRKHTIRTYFDAELVSWQGWTQKQKLNVGYACLWLFNRSLPGLLETSQNGQLYQAGRRLLHQVQHVLSQQAGSWALYPPMVVKPKPWSAENLFKGGYVSDALPRYPIIKRAGRKDADRLQAMDWTIPFAAINALQETGYRINGQMVEALQWAFRDHDKPIGKMPAMSDIPFPPKPWNYYHDKTAKKAHRLACYMVRDANRISRAKRLTVAMALSIAGSYKPFEAIYFPHNMDNRGRAYPVPGILNPQASEHIRSILEFADGHPVETKEHADWLAINGANAWRQ